MPIKKKGFGSSALWINGKIFALLSNDKQFVVKLPKDRVDDLVVRDRGERFDPRRNGKIMKEWLIVKSTSESEWRLLANEAMRFALNKT